MELDKILKRRYSCRSYISKNINDKDLTLMLNNAILSPNAGNLQAWRFIAVKDQDKKEEIATACLQQKWMTQAALQIVIIADLDYVKKHYKERAELYCIQDCALAASNIMLTAASLNIDSCFVSAFDEDMLKRALSMPKNIIPYVVLTLGYSNEKPEDKKRYPISTSLYFNNYGNKNQDKNIFPIMKFKPAIHNLTKKVLNKIKRKK